MQAQPEILLNRRTGLFEQTITVTNSAKRAIGGFILDVTGLVDGYTLHGQEGNRYSHLMEIGPGDAVSLTFEYHFPQSRQGPTPELGVSLTLPESDEIGGPTGAEIDRILPQTDGSIIIEFAAVPGVRYGVEYSTDLVTWNLSPLVIEAGANRIQWHDKGLPKTNCHPRDCSMRLYRVVQNNLSPPSAPVQGRLQSPPTKSKFLAVIPHRQATSGACPGGNGGRELNANSRPLSLHVSVSEFQDFSVYFPNHRRCRTLARLHPEC